MSVATAAVLMVPTSVIPNLTDNPALDPCLPPTHSLRVSRFLRAVGDPTSKFGSSAASAEAAVGAVGSTAPWSAAIGGALAEAIPTALEVTSKGLLCGSGVAADGTDGVDRNAVGVSGAGGGGRSGGGADGKGDEAKAAEKRAIENIFRAVDLDASGHVSEEELLEAVSVAYDKNKHGC